MKKFLKLFSGKKPLIGMIHLPPLPGYERHPGMKAVINKAMTDLETLQSAGFDGVLVENDNDQPHYIQVPASIREAFSETVAAVMHKAFIPVGMEIIYDMKATVEVADAIGVDFVRLDVFADDVETKWGIIKASAGEIGELRSQMRQDALVILTDVQVKHAQLVVKRELKISAKESIDKGSDGLIVTGNWTGEEPAESDILEIEQAANKKAPIIIGSGFSHSNAEKLWGLVDGAIVGTAIKTGEYIDAEKAERLNKLIKF